MSDGLLPHRMTITTENQSFGVNDFSVRPTEADGADGFARYRACGTRDAGGGESDISMGIDERALGHVSGDFFADGA